MTTCQIFTKRSMFSKITFVLVYPANDPKAQQVVSQFQTCSGSPDGLNQFFEQALSQGYCSQCTGNNVFELYQGTPNGK